jgi:cobalamin-dependent methionine synthase I
VLNEALVEGMRIVGIDFRDGILFVPEVLLAANSMKAAWRSCGRCWPRPARAHRQDGDRHRQGRHSRHRQEPGLA